jgi:hypothetical protein
MSLWVEEILTPHSLTSTAEVISARGSLCHQAELFVNRIHRLGTTNIYLELPLHHASPPIIAMGLNSVTGTKGVFDRPFRYLGIL